MSEIHEFKCDKCQAKVPAKYNGEHYLPPVEWARLYNDAAGMVLNFHICGKCRIKLNLCDIKKNGKPSNDT